jgi:PAS domain S-box-containing protein
VVDARGLEELQADLQLALQAGRMGTWSWDRATGVVTWDEGMAALFGIELDEFAGTYADWINRLHPDDRANSEDVINRAVDESTGYTLVRRVLWPDGSVHWLEGRADVTTDVGGIVSGARGVSMDVTEREESARRTEALQHDLTLLAKAGVVLASTLDTELLVRRFAELVVPAVADACEIDLLEPTGTMRRTVHAAGVSTDMVRRRELQPLDLRADHPIALVVRTGEPLVLNADDENASWGLGSTDMETSARAMGVDRAVIVPLRVRSSTIGAIAFAHVERRPLLEHDLRIAEELARRFALAYDNAELYRAQRTIADTLQRGLLPASMPVVAGLDVAARYWVSGSGVDVGGDFYDIVTASDDPSTVTLLIGDVCGKGVRAASLTALARHTLRAAALEGADPATGLQWLHRALVAEGASTFVTVVLARLDVSQGQALGSVAIGGHPRPIIRRADGSTEELDVAGPPPGMAVWSEPPVVALELGDGDTLFLYTDGVTDVPGDAALSTTELHGLISGVGSGAPEEILDAVSTELERRRPRHLRSDDIALLAAQVTATTSSMDFPPERSSPALVRRWLTGRLGDDHPSLDDVLLCASELVSNVVLHTGLAGTVRLRRDGARARVEVIDKDEARLPAPREHARDSVTGRGLHLVGDVALAWGSAAVPGGKVVWFEIADGDG